MAMPTANSARSASLTWRLDPQRPAASRQRRAGLHVLEAMEAFQISADEGRRVKLETTVERPTMMPPGLPTGAMD